MSQSVVDGIILATKFWLNYTIISTVIFIVLATITITYKNIGS